MMYWGKWAAGFAATFFSAGIGGCEPQAADLVIENVTVIDGTGRPPKEGVSVTITDNRIADIRRGGDTVSVDDNVRRIDGAGKFLIPGLMDMHIHLKGGSEITKDGLRKPAINRKQGIGALHSYLYSGVTSLYDSGNNPDFIMGLREGERSGKITAPRIFATGAIVTYPGSHGSSYEEGDVSSWPEAIETLDRHLKRKPDIVKLTLEERGWGARPMIPILPVALMEKIIEYYNDQGVRTTVHTPSEVRARQAIYAGVDNLSHPVITGPVSEKFVKLMGAKKTPMVTTLTIGENYGRLEQSDAFLDEPIYRASLSESEIEMLKTEVRERYTGDLWTKWMTIMTPVAQENLRLLHEGGAVLVLGTDQTIGPAVHREMQLLVDAGIPPLDVIRIATQNAAVFLGREDELGTIEEGKLADVVLLNADPSEDIANAKSIDLVIKNGVVVDFDKLALPGRR
ncbi:MAG: amidohydrolase family protein [Hyphomicrobiales bacterium]|nr:amidohydrolase family protein [Hyphomicrobiales bacterium]